MGIYAAEILTGLLRIGFAKSIPSRFYAHGFHFLAARACYLHLPEVLDPIAERFAQQTVWCRDRCVAAEGYVGRRTTDWFRADISVGRKALHSTQRFFGGALASRAELDEWQDKVASHARTPMVSPRHFLAGPLALTRPSHSLYAGSSVRSPGVEVGLLPSQSKESCSALANKPRVVNSPMLASPRISQPAYGCVIPTGASPATYEALLCYLGSRGAHPVKELLNGPGSRSAVFEERWRPAILECFGHLAVVLGEELAVEPREEVRLP